MADVYKVGVTVSMTNMVSSVLKVIVKDLKLAEASTLAFKRSLNELKIAGLTAGVGSAGLMFLKPALDAAKGYQTAMANLATMGVGDAILNDADKFARGSNVIGTSATEMITTLRQLTTVFGPQRYSLAKELAPTMAALNFANKAIFGDKWSEEQELDMERIIERKGGWKTSAEFYKQADYMQKVLTGLGGQVMPSDFMNMMNTEGVSGLLFNDKQFYFVAAAIAQEMKAGRVGTGFMSAYNNLAQGKTTVRAAREMMRLGLLDPKQVDWDKIGQLKAVHPGALKGYDEYTASPYAWMNDVLLPALAAKGITDKQKILDEMGTLMGNRTGSNLFGIMYTNDGRIKNAMQTMGGAMGIGGTVEKAKDTLGGSEDALTASWKLLMENLGKPLLPLATTFVRGLDELVRGVNKLVFNNPNAIKAMVVGFAALSAGLTTYGIGTALSVVTRLLFGFGMNLNFLVRGATALYGVGARLVPILGTAASAIGLLPAAIIGVGAALVLTFPKIEVWKGAWHELGGAMEDLGATVTWLINKFRHPFSDDSDGQDYKLAHMRGNLGYVPGQRPVFHVHNTFDRHGIATMVTQEQVKAADGPSKGYSGFDMRGGYTPPPVGGY
jgi:hypothetical protein